MRMYDKEYTLLKMIDDGTGAIMRVECGDFVILREAEKEKFVCKVLKLSNMSTGYISSQRELRNFLNCTKEI